MRLRYIPSGGWFERNELFVLRLIALIILVAIYLVAAGYADSIIAFVNPDFKGCSNGRCKDSCNAETESQKFEVKCIDHSKVCCIPKTKLVSDECNGLSPGQECGDNKLCDESLKCVSKCEYCSRFPSDTACIINSEVIGRDVTELNPSFRCGCTAKECASLAESLLGTCVKNFCPTTNSMDVDYMCCDR